MKQRQPKRPHVAAPLVDGTPVQLGGRQYVMPPLNAVDAARYWDRIEAAEHGKTVENLNLTVTLVTACLRRNYPAITEDDVAPHVDLDNLRALSAAVLGRGAFRAWLDQQKAEALGNAPAPQPAPAAGTGAPSTPASPPPPAGTSETSTN